MLKGETVEPLDKTPLAVAVAAGDVESARVLLEAGGCFYTCVHMR